MILIEWTNKSTDYPRSRKVYIGNPDDDFECAVVSISLAATEENKEWLFYRLPDVLDEEQCVIVLNGADLKIRTKQIIQKQKSAVAHKVVCRILLNSPKTELDQPRGN